MTAVRVLIVDDQEPFRRAAASVVGMTDPFELVGAVGSGEECLAVVPRLRPDLVLLDVGLPGIDGIETAARLRALLSPPVVILVSTHDEREFADGVARSGAAAYVTKSAFGPDRLAAVWALAGNSGGSRTVSGSSVS